ncbi:MAG: hypothetical protein ILA52_00035 [Alphaproteobacteria bacterium]|nr:hypothetical protein [Alphaproteobacteria bacterium]
MTVYYNKNNLSRPDNKNNPTKSRIQNMKRQKQEHRQMQVSEDIWLACKNFIRTASAEDEQALAEVLTKHNLKLTRYPYSEPNAKSYVARLAFTGYAERPAENHLSPLLKECKTYPNKRNLNVKSEDYDLSYSSSWQIFKQIPEFAALEDKVKTGLAYYGIPAEKISSLNANDITYILCDQLGKPYNSGTKLLAESYKARNTKKFIQENEMSFRRLMINEGARLDYVDALVMAMKEGKTDLTKFKDKDGKPVWKEEWKDQKVIDVHHIINIKDAYIYEKIGLNFTDVNDYKNMCFIAREPDHDNMHALELALRKAYSTSFEKNVKIGDAYYRIEPLRNIRCMAGTNSLIMADGSTITAESEKDPETAKQNQEKTLNNLNAYRKEKPSGKLYNRHRFRQEQRNTA